MAQDKSGEPRTIGPFRLGKQLGVGGMGIVYEGIYEETGLKVAVKILAPGLIQDAKLLKRFDREVEILKRLKHPNIVKYFGGGRANNQRYYAMEFIDGGSLQHVLNRRKKLTWEQALHVGRQVASALEHSHAAGIIHRDLKPANLFMTRKGRLKLGDFGIARDTEATALTAAGKTLGTYAYMAPEQIQAGPPISRKTDIYALGCLMYELIVGETPFVADNPMDMLMQHLNDDPYNVMEKVPECPIWLDQLIERMLAKDPDDRPYDALAVHTELGEIRERVKKGNSVLKTNAEIAGSGEIKKVTRQKKKRKKKKQNLPFHEQTWFLATCLLALIVATAYLLWPKSEQAYADEWRLAMNGGRDIQSSALDNLLVPYLEKFPEGIHRDEAQQFADQIRANKLEAQLDRLARRDREYDLPIKADAMAIAKLEDEMDLRYLSSWSTETERELVSNPVPVMYRWKKLLEKYDGSTSDDPEHRILQQVARNHYDYFRSRLLVSPRLKEFMLDWVKAAEELHSQDEIEQAELRWKFTFQEFRNNKDLKEINSYAARRFNKQAAEIPDDNPADTPENSS